MDKFITKKHTVPIDVNLENFIEYTKRKAPYYTKNGEERGFAICPLCKNPVQFYGLFKRDPDKTKGNKPHARHVDHNITGLADYDHERYLNCDYASGRYEFSNTKQREMSEFSLEIYRAMINNFDLVVGEIYNVFGIYLKEEFCKKELRKWIRAKDFLNLDTSIASLPYAFMTSLESHKLFGRLVYVNSKLCNDIEKHSKGIVLTKQFSNSNELKQIQAVDPKSHLDMHFIVANLNVAPKGGNPTHYVCELQYNINEDDYKIKYKIPIMQFSEKVRNADPNRNNAYLDIAKEVAKEFNYSLT